MSLSEHLRSLTEYDGWANARLLEQAGKLTTAELVAAAPVSHESILGNFAHMVWAQATWLSRWMGEPPLTGGAPERLKDLTILRGVYDDVGEALRTFVASRTEADFDRVVAYQDTRGRPFERPLATLVLQVLNHGTYHRGETAIALTQLGHSPGDLDYVYFTFERDKTGR